MKFSTFSKLVSFLCAILLISSCGDNVKSTGISATTSPLPASHSMPAVRQIPRVAPLTSSPVWISMSRKDAAAMCYIDTVNGSGLKLGGVPVKVARNTALAFEGWAFDKKTRGEQTEVALELASPDRKQVYLFMIKRTSRPDVTNHQLFRSLALEIPGIADTVDIDKVASGVYGITLVMRRGDSEGITCPIGSDWQVEL